MIGIHVKPFRNDYMSEPWTVEDEETLFLQRIMPYCEEIIKNKVSKTELKKILIAGISALEQEPKWISVSERLPEESITVIGITTFDDIYKAELYDDCGEKKWYADGNFDVPIVAWMPLPEPYKESEG